MRQVQLQPQLLAQQKQFPLPKAKLRHTAFGMCIFSVVVMARRRSSSICPIARRALICAATDARSSLTSSIPNCRRRWSDATTSPTSERWLTALTSKRLAQQYA